MVIQLRRTTAYATFHGLWIHIWIHVYEEYCEIIPEIMCTKVPDVQELYRGCPREFVVSSDPRSAPKTAKKPFFLKSHWSRLPLSLGRGSQLHTELILVDTKWQWVDTGRLCAGAHQAVGAGIGTETTCIIVRGNLTFTLSLQKTQLPAPSGPSTGR